MNARKIVTIFIIGTGLLNRPIATNAETPRARMGVMKGEIRFQEMINKATEVYKSIVKDAHDGVPVGVTTNARCIAVLPNVLTGALGVGAAHGDGLASCKLQNGKWSQLAAISLREGSIGLQAGAKKTDLVLFFQTPESETALKNGKISFGAEASAVAGKYEKSFDTAKAGVVVYSHTKGVFAGASINGSRIGKDTDELVSYYGKTVNYTAILEGNQSPDTTAYSDKLTTMFP